MRIFKVKKGKFAGEHEIYDSVDEFRKSFPDKHLRNPWYGMDTAPFDWCISDDGYVIQCLDRYNLVNRWKQTTYCYRFCNGLYYSWDTKQGLKARRLDAALTKRHRSTLSETGPESYKVNQFIIYLNAGFNVYEAYRRAFFYGRQQFIDRADLLSKINLLLIRYEDRLVEGLKTFIQKLDDKIREKTGKEPEDVLVEKIAEMVVDTPSSNSRELRENIKLYMQLKNASLKHGKALGTEYTIDEERPPLLEENSDDSNT